MASEWLLDPAGGHIVTLDDRIRRLEDRVEIRELLTRYCLLIDDREMDGVAALFTPDGAFRSRDGVLNACGTEAVVAQFAGRFAALGPSFHFTHDLVLRFDDADPDLAFGTLTSHAEVVREGVPMLTAIRYADTYSRHEGRWKFKDRLLSFLYYLPVDEYVSAMRGALRMRAYGDPRPADFPESLASWQRHHRDAGVEPPPGSDR